MFDDYKSSAPTAQLGGAKRKNGHKDICSCHICENMKNKAKRGGYEDDAEKNQMKLMGGSKKKNGHKMNCSCPICKNMKNAKKGGYNAEKTEGEYNQIDNNDSNITGGKLRKGKAKGTRKSNGHKVNCSCPICKNMRKKTRRGGDIVEGFGKGDESVEPVEAVKPVEAVEAVKPVEAVDVEYDEVANALELPAKGPGPELIGGSRKRRSSGKSNGHKLNCGCPICKNMRRGNKTRRHRKRSSMRR